MAQPPCSAGKSNALRHQSAVTTSGAYSIDRRDMYANAHKTICFLFCPSIRFNSIPPTPLYSYSLPWIFFFFFLLGYSEWHLDCLGTRSKGPSLFPPSLYAKEGLFALVRPPQPRAAAASGNSQREGCAQPRRAEAHVENVGASTVQRRC